MPSAARTTDVLQPGQESVGAFNVSAPTRPHSMPAAQRIASLAFLTAVATPTTTLLCSACWDCRPPGAVFDRLLTAFFSLSPSHVVLCIDNSDRSASYHKGTEPAHFDIGGSRDIRNSYKVRSGTDRLRISRIVWLAVPVKHPASFSRLIWRSFLQGHPFCCRSASLPH
jgi:hypothetical protein